MVVELYPRSSHDAFHGVQVQFPPHVDEAVQQIVSATKGFGTDEKALISVLGSKSPETRTLIAMRYEQLHRKPLKDLMKSEASGDFGRLLRMIAAPLHETEAQLLRDATKGAGTNENLVVQIISGRTNEEMDILKKTYFRLFNKDLAVTLNSELGGDFRKVIMAMLQSQQVPYNPAFHTAAKAEEEAIKLYKAGQGRLGTKEEEFIGILVAAPSEFLRLMDAAYVRKYSNNIAKAVDKEFSGDAKKALQYLVKSVMDPFPTIAEVFEKTMKGFGTDETGLSTALVRYHCVLPKVKEAYKKLYGKELRDRIHGEISGDYRQLALQLYDAPQDPPPSAAAKAPAGAPTGAPAPGAPMPGAPAPGAQQHGYAAPYGQAPGAPAPGAAPTGYPPQGQQPHGYPPQGQPGYPPQQPPAGYPPQQPPAGYPPQQPPAGYPPHQAAPGYPPQQQHAPAPGYPPQQQQPYGYPPQGQQPHGYPPQGQPGYPPQGQPGYPPQQGHYPPQGQPGYPPQGQPGYPPQQGFAQPGYPPQGQPGYPPQQGFAQPGYPPQGQPGYPPQGQPGYPPHGY